MGLLYLFIFEWFERNGRMNGERRVKKLLKGKPGGGMKKRGDLDEK